MAQVQQHRWRDSKFWESITAGRQRMCVLGLFFGLLTGFAQPFPFAPGEEVQPDPAPLFLASFDPEHPSDLDRAIAALIAAIESSGKPVRPESYPTIGLKVYTHSGPGLHTPHALVRSVIRALLERGYARESIFICDLDTFRLRETGFLPPLSRGGATFEGVPVIALDDPGRLDSAWYYDSPLPPKRFGPPGVAPDEAIGDDRKSFLPAPLLFQADYWINLPVFTDHDALGINGALANMTLWSVTNQERFFSNRVSAAAAAAEIAAIPEYRRTYGFTLASLDNVQFIGGPPYDANFAAGVPLAIASRDAVAVDRFALLRINNWRRDQGFRPVPEDLPLFRYAESLGLGDPSLTTDRLVDIPKQRAKENVPLR